MLTKKEKAELNEIEQFIAYNNTFTELFVERLRVVTENNKKLNWLGIGKFFKMNEYRLNNILIGQYTRIIDMNKKERAMLQLEYNKLLAKEAEPKVKKK